MTDLRVVTTEGSDAILEEAADTTSPPIRAARCCAPATADMTRPAKSGTA
jgi:hypothetical protein